MATTPQPYGILLPIQRGPNGYFNQSRSITEQIKSNLNLLLRTKKGERRMNPDFGSGLWSVLFEQNNESIKPIIESTIRSDIGKWMPYVNVTSVTIDDTADATQHRLNVSLSFTVPSIGLSQEQILQVSMNTPNV